MSHLIVFIAGLVLPGAVALAYLVIRNKYRNPVRESFEEEDGWTP